MGRRGVAEVLRSDEKGWCILKISFFRFMEDSQLCLHKNRTLWFKHDIAPFIYVTSPNRAFTVDVTHHT